MSPLRCVLFTLSPLWFYCWHFMIVCGVLLTWFVAHLSSWVFWGTWLGGEIFSNCSLRKGSCWTSPPSTKYLTILIRRQISYRSRHNSATYKTRAISSRANFIFRLVWCCVSFVSFHFESWPQPSLDTQTKGGVIEVLCCRLKEKPRAKSVTNLYGTIT